MKKIGEKEEQEVRSPKRVVKPIEAPPIFKPQPIPVQIPQPATVPSIPVVPPQKQGG